MPIRSRSPYPLRITTTTQYSKRPRIGRFVVVAAVFLVGGLFLIPKIVTIEVKQNQTKSIKFADSTPFPVSVDTTTKSIVPNPQADELFQNSSQLTAAADSVSSVISWIALTIDNTPLYQSLAGADGRLIVVKPGQRKEQILAQLKTAMNWNADQQKQFMDAVTDQTPGLTDGMFTPGNYVVDQSMTPSNVAALMNLAFNKNILLHYSSTTEQHVPLPVALTVASLLEREAKDTTDMREISGIIWNRLFNNMNLQIDATLQYAKGENKSGYWWTTVVPKDKYVKSPYNTYAHPGLPPGPIAEPSIAAVLAALNPIETDCLFYFHDKYGNFHCTKTYAEHVALLKKYYGQGK